MGFFKLFYYLKRILYKIPKKILIYLLIFVIYFVFVFSPSSHASQIDVNNVPNADIIDLYQKQIDHNFYVFTYRAIESAKRNNNTFDGNFKSFCRSATTQNAVFGIYTPNYYNLYFKRNGTYLNDSESWLCLCWTNPQNYIDDDTVVIPGTSNSNYSSSREVSCSVYSNATVSRFSTTTTNPSFYGNTGYNVTLIDAFKNYIPSDLYDVLYSIGNDTFSFTNDNQVLQEISEKIDETNDQLEQMNDFFNSDTTPTVTPSDLPSDSMNDITASGFNGIFTKIYNEVTYDNNSRIKITIPYVNYEFYLYSNYLSNTFSSIPLFQNFSWGDYSILTFIQLLWSFAIYRYIVLDIYKYINEIKNGNISTTDTNIKADML